MPPKSKREHDDLEHHAQFPPKLSVLDIQSTWEEHHVGEYYGRILVNEIVAEMEQEIVRAHMDHTSVPWTIQGIVTDLMECISLNFVEREDFELSDSDPPDVEIHIAEPHTPNADAWARAAIPQRTPLVRPDSEQFSTMKTSVQPRDRRPQSQASSSPPLRSSVAFSSEPAEPGSQPTTTVNKREGHHERERASGSKARASAAPSQTESAGGAQPGSNDAPPATNDDTIVLTAEERRLLEVNRKSSERMQSLRAAAEKLNKQFHDLRNAQGTLVVDGATNTVVVVTKPEGRKMSARLEPRVQIPDETAGAPAAVTAQKKGPSGKGSPTIGGQKPPGSAKAPGAEGSKKPRGDPSQFWHPEQQTSPMILGVTPVGGVQAKEGDTVRRNELKQQKSRISKSEYSKLLMLQQQSRLSAGTEPLFDPHTAVEPTPLGLASVASSRQLVSHASGLAKSTTGFGDTTTKAPLPALGEASNKTSFKQPQPEKANPPTRVRSPLVRRTSSREKDGESAPTLLPDPEQIAKIPRCSTPRKAARVNPLHVARAASATPAGGLKEIVDRARAITPTIEAAVGSRLHRPSTSQVVNGTGHIRPFKPQPGRGQGILVTDPGLVGLSDDDSARDPFVGASQLSYPSFGATLSLTGSV